MNHDIFSRLLKYSFNKEKRQVENFLTEILGYCLENCFEFKSEFIKKLKVKTNLNKEFKSSFCNTAEHYLTVKTQVPIKLNSETSMKYVDLVLSDKNFYLLIEVKVNSDENYSDLDGEDIGQIEIYQKYLKSLTDHDTQLILLVKNEWDLKDQKYPKFTWQEIGIMAVYSLNKIKNKKNEFILKSFTHILQEEGIYMEKSMNIKDITILSEYIAVKEKLWQTLKLYKSFLTNNFKVNSSNTTYGMASGYEEDDNEFMNYFYIGKSIELHVGFISLDDSFEPAACIVLICNNDSIYKRVDAFLRSSTLKINPIDTGNQGEWEFHEEDTMPIQIYRNLIEFIGDDAMDEVLNFFKEKTKELLQTLEEEDLLNK